MRVAPTVITAALLLPPRLANANEPGVGAMLQAFAGLAVVMVLLVGALFLLKRFTPGQFPRSDLLRPVATLTVGPRERVVIIELGEQWIVTGVTAHAVNVLLVCPKGELPQSGAADPGGFASLLARTARARVNP